MDDADLPPVFARRLTDRQLILIDVGAALACTALVLMTSQSPDLRGWIEVAIAAGVGLPIALRRLWPRHVLAVVFAFSLAGVVLDAVAGPFVAASLATYTVALTEPTRAWVPTRTIGVLGLSTVLVVMVAGPTGWTWSRSSSVILGSALVAGAWALGRAIRDRRAYARHTAEQLALRAVTDERLRIARELHDVVAHGMSVITVKAGIANHVVHEHPEEAAEALRIIESTGRRSLTEMRRLLGVLRSETDDRPADLAPAPGLDGLAALADQTRMAGVDVDLQIRIDGELPEGVELSAYRIAQEALTNVVKHAAPAQCRLEVSTDRDGLTVEISDDGAGPVGSAVQDTETRTRHGVVGMYERVAMYGGTFSAGPLPGGGFAVRATIPYSVTSSVAELR